MNYRLILNIIGKMLALEGVLMVPSMCIALIYREGDAPAFILTMLLLMLLGLPLMLRFNPGNKDIGVREGLVAVALCWILMSAFGALPFILSRTLPHFWDALFETVSGFTTTGASVFIAVEGLPHGILFWRSFTHWVGGMGVLLLTLALMPGVRGGGSSLAKAEAPGPTFSKVTPRMADTARLMYLVYAGMSLVELLLLLLSGLSLFDAFIHTFGTAGTGGFSNRNQSVGAYRNVWAEMIIMAFMFLFGTNFSVYVRLLRGEGFKALKSDEVRAYYLIALASVLLIGANILPHFGNVWEALRHSGFQVATVMSTTGFATADFALWPMFSQALMVILMLIGACAGSTAGGLKVVRAVMLSKSALREVGQNMQPRKVRVIMLDGKSVNEETQRGVLAFFFIYITALMLGTLLVALDGFSFTTSFTAVLSCLSNIGPGLELIGPMGNFAMFSPPVKFLMSLLMLAGRLEFFALFALFHPAVWKKGH